MPSRPFAPGLLLSLALAGCSGDAGPAIVPAFTPGSSAPRIGQHEAPDKPLDTSKSSVAENINAGVTAMKLGDLAVALTRFEAAVKAEPDSRRGLLLLGVAASSRAEQVEDRPAKLALIHRSAEALRTLGRTHNDLDPEEKGIIGLGIVHEAGAYASESKPDQAMTALGEAVDAGFEDDWTLEQDRDLDPLRSRPDFPAIVARVKAAQATRVVAAMKKFRPFPFNFRLPDLDGKPVRLDDFRGKVTIVDFWGTWCPPCQKEIPHFLELLKRYEREGLAVVGINYEKVLSPGANALIADFRKQNGLTYPCVLGDEQTLNQVPNFSAYPTTLFIDRAGKVRLVLEGYQPMSWLAAITRVLLDETPGKANL